MKNQRVRSLVVLIVAFFAVVYVSLTYFWIGSFNILEFNKSVGVLFSKADAISYDVDYIEQNRQVNKSEPNGLNVSNYSYNLELKDIPSNIISVSIEFDDRDISVGNISLSITKGDNTESVSVSNGNTRNCVKSVCVTQRDINSVSLYSSFDNFGSSIANEQMLSVSKIKVNNADDIAMLKNDFFFSILKSVVAAVVILLVAVIILKSRVDNLLFKRDFKIEKVFLITSLIVGVAFAVLFPVFQVPDEKNHINIMYGELNWNMQLDDYAGDFADTLRVIRNYDQKVDLSTYYNADITSRLPSEFALPSLTIIRHLPQAIGFVLCTLLGLPLFVAHTAGELCAVAVYSLFGYFAVKLIPYKKELFTALLLLPVSLQEFPSFSYDSFLNASIFLFIAYALYIKFVKEKFTLPDLLLLLALLLVIAITKLPYALVAVLIILIPISKLDFNFGIFRLRGEFILKHKTVFIISAAAVVVVGGIVALKILSGIMIGKVLLAAIYALKDSIGLFSRTISLLFGRWLVELTGNFGWFDTPVALVFTVFVVANLLFLNLFDNYNVTGKHLEKNPFSVFDIIVMLAAGFLMFIITILALFEHTTTVTGIDIWDMSIPQIAQYMKILPYIGGIQGRYFIPAIPMILMPIYFAKPTAAVGKINHKSYLCMYHLIVFVYMGVVILMRFWI